MIMNSIKLGPVADLAEHESAQARADCEHHVYDHRVVVRKHILRVMILKEIDYFLFFSDMKQITDNNNNGCQVAELSNHRAKTPDQEFPIEPDLET